METAYYFLIAFVLLIITIGALMYFNIIPNPLSKTRTLDELQGLAQALETGEVDVGAGKKIVTNQPTGIDKSKVTYTLSIDINVIKTSSNNFRLLHNRSDNDNNTPCTPGIHGCTLGAPGSFTVPAANTQRRPEIWITGTSEPNGANRIWVNHVLGDKDYYTGNLQTKFQAKENEYFNLTYVIDNGTCIGYINGVQDGEYSGDFRWSPEADSWTWNMYDYKTDIVVKVKNVYFFNTALTEQEVNTFIGQ